MTASTVLYNPSFDASKVDWLGFDLDHALVRYKVPATMELIYSCLIKYLYLHCDYPREVLDKPFIPSFCGKGVIGDLENGNFLTVTPEGHIIRATHAFRELTDEEILATYPDRHWSGISILKKRVKHESFFVFLTYFDMPAMVIIARLIEHYDSEGRKYDFIKDLFAAFMHNFDHSSFENDIGWYHPAIKQNLSKYLEPRPGMREWILEARSRGQYIWVCTNSHVGYGTQLLKFAFGDDWEKVFDVVIFNGLKPGFFMRIHPFFHFDEEKRTEGQPCLSVRTHGPTLCQGNATAIQALADSIKTTSRPSSAVVIHLDEEGHVTSSSETDSALSSGPGRTPEAHSEREHTVSASLIDGVDDPSEERTRVGSHRHATTFAYVGDHIHGDVLPTKLGTNWHPICVLEELELDHPEGFPTTTYSSEDAPNASSPWYNAHTEWGDFFTAGSDSLTYLGSLVNRASSMAVSDASLLMYSSELRPVPATRRLLTGFDSSLRSVSGSSAGAGAGVGARSPKPLPRPIVHSLESEPFLAGLFNPRVLLGIAFVSAAVFAFKRLR